VALHEIVQPTPVPLAETQVVVEPAAAVAPLMNTAACAAEGETNAGFRRMLEVLVAGSAIVMVPLTCCKLGEPVRPLAELPPELPPEHAASETTLTMQATLRRSTMGLLSAKRLRNERPRH
jgi:hypothetical protein